ncbi:MAG: hypothetical protein IH934_02090 [Nanoarchaeota archaeon]|nr:hypothetical protein [Nanoarchaeota archaeon]
MSKKKRIGFLSLFLLLLVIFISSCGLIKKDEGDGAKFERGAQGLVMDFVQNYPQQKFLVSNEDEDIVVAINVRNIGTYPIKSSKKSQDEEEGIFGLGKIYISGFDDEIIDMSGLTDEDITKLKNSDRVDISELALEELLAIRDEYYPQIKNDQINNRKTTLVTINVVGILDEKKKDAILNLYKKGTQKARRSKSLSGMFLQPASEINPKGGFDSTEFEGKIKADKIIVDQYDPVILATACYPYFTKASPTVCIDPFPFEHREEKVCEIGSVTLSSQGAPIAVTKVEQEAATGKIQFKIHIKNVGDGDVIWNKDTSEDISKLDGLLNRCSPLGGGILKRKDFDRVQLESIKIGNVDMFKERKCSPFADGTDNIVKLFNGEGFVICTLNVRDLGSIQSAYTSPLNIELRYAYRSTISKQIKISKLTTIDSEPTDSRPTTRERAEERPPDIPAETGVPSIPIEQIDTVSGPTGTVKINNDDKATSKTSVTLSFTCSDPIGCKNMKVANTQAALKSALLIPYITKMSRLIPSGDGTKYVWVRFQNRADIWSHEFVDSILLRTIGPTGSIKIDEDAKNTLTKSVILNLHCSDPSGCKRMRIANEQKDLAYATQKIYDSLVPSWELSTADGTKTKAVWVQFENEVGLWGNELVDTIIFGALPPGTIMIDEDASTTSTTKVFLNLFCSDPSGCTNMQIANKRKDFDNAKIIPFSSPINWFLPSGDGTKSVWFKYLSGNNIWSEAFADSIILSTLDLLGDILIDDDALTTSTSLVTLRLYCFDKSGCDKMQIADTYSGLAGADSEDFKPEILWTLPSGDGTKIVWFRYLNGNQIWSEAFFDKITLGKIPTGTVKINFDNKATTSTAVILTFTCSEPNGCKNMQIAHTDATLPFAPIREFKDQTNDWILTSGDGPKSVFVRFQNEDGFWGNGNADVIILRTSGPTGTVKINGVAESTSSRSVDLSLSCKDLSGCKNMQISNNRVGLENKPVIDYSPSLSWYLPTSGEGTKYVYVRFQNYADLWSGTILDRIELSTSS